MSSAFPTRTVLKNGTDVSSDVSTLTWTEREITAGTSTFQLDLNNVGGKYSSALGTDAGLYEPWTMTLNGKTRYGRALAWKVAGSVGKELLTVTGGLMDESLKNYYLLSPIYNDTLVNMITKALQQNVGTNSMYSVPPPAYTVPKFGSNVDCSKTTPYVHDFIRELLTSVVDVANSSLGWSGYVNSYSSPVTASINIFPIGALSYATSLTWGGNVSTIEATQSIEQTKNSIEYAGGLSTTEPADGLAWTNGGTNGTLGWSVNSGTVVSLATGTANLPPNPATNNIASILASNRGGDVDFTLHLPTTGLLGEPYNCVERNALSLDFQWKAIAINTGIGPAPVTFIPMMVYLKNGTNVLQSNNSFISTLVSGPTISWQQFARNIGPTSSIGVIQTPQPIPQLANYDWYAADQATASSFNWGGPVTGGTIGGGGGITDIEFKTSALGGVNAAFTVQMWVNGLRFNQNYQPIDFADGYSKGSAIAYGTRMLYYSCSQFTEDADIVNFAKQKTVSLCAPLCKVVITTSLGPESETNGFLPGYCFPTAQMPAVYGLQSWAWRAVEVETKYANNGVTTKFTLTPATSIGYGVTMNKFDPRRFW